MKKSKVFLVPFFVTSTISLLIFLGCSQFKSDQFIERNITSAEKEDYYTSNVKPIIDNRCVTCHACWNAPCQLNMQSFEGIERGATKTLVYGLKLAKRAPSRLGIDAHSASEWHSKKEFYPVLDRENPENSLFYKMIVLGNNYHQNLNYNPSEITKYAIRTEEQKSCPKSNLEFKLYEKMKPQFGMPYNMAPLKEEEFQTLVEWLNMGAPGPSEEVLSSMKKITKGMAEINKWEDFFNNQNPKNVVSSRYLFEHLFTAHIYFKNNPGEFFRLVRSTTPSPNEVSEIPSRRPYDPPNVDRFYYRFIKITETLAHKTHLPFEFSDEKLNRFKELFIDSKWNLKDGEKVEIPVYDSLKSSNPFIVFKQVPPLARYRFLIENSRFIWESIFRGSSCRSSLAINVIPDRFIQGFLDPKSDLSVTDPNFLEEAAPYLALPAESEAKLFVKGYTYYKRAQIKYTELRERYYRAAYPEGLSIKDVWDGDGYNKNAVITVARNNEGGSTLLGMIGGVPKESGILDYPLFERLHYNLTTNWDVWGATSYIIKTRIYTDNIRQEAGDVLLSFLPNPFRQNLRKTWYVGFVSEKKAQLRYPFREKDWPTAIKFNTSNPHVEFWDRLYKERLAGVYPKDFDPINSFTIQKNVPIFEESIDSERELDKEFGKISNLRGAFVESMPESSLLRVRRKGEEDLIYTIIRDTFHDNVSSLLLETSAIHHELDTLIIIKGVVDSFPNFIFDVNLEDMPQFFKSLYEVKLGKKGDLFYWKNNHPTFTSFINRFGIKKGDPRIWDSLDWFNRKFKKDNPIEAGVLDMLRYNDF